MGDGDWRQYTPGGGTGGTATGFTPPPRLPDESIADYQGRVQRAFSQWQALTAIQGALPPNIAANGVQIDEFHWVDPGTLTVYELGRNADGTPKFSALSDADSKRYLGSIGVGGIGAGGTRLTSDDPRYWDLQYKQLQAQLMNMGLDAESARRQALASLIANRNAQSVDLASTSGNIAAQAAQLAGNPRDAPSELMFRNAVASEGQGGAPFGAAMSSPSFPKYQTALQDKFQELFGGVGGDLERARQFVSSPPPAEFFGPELRQDLNLPAFPPINIPGLAEGGTVSTRTKPGYSPTSAEGGLNLNLFEPAMVVGMDSGHVYATVAEPRPDGSRRGEQLIVKPLPSEVEKDKKFKEQGKKATQSFASMAQGGTVNVPDPSDFINELRKSLSGLGGPGGGAGAFGTPLPDLRLLAGEPMNRLLEDPDLLDYALAGYSSFGISPRSALATVKKFTPSSPINNAPRVSFLS